MSHDSDNFYIKSNNNKLSHVVISYWRQAELGKIAWKTTSFGSIPWFPKVSYGKNSNKLSYVVIITYWNHKEEWAWTGPKQLPEVFYK